MSLQNIVVYLMTCLQRYTLQSMTRCTIATDLTLECNYNYRNTYKILREPQLACVNSICAVIVQVLTLAFLCKNLDYKPQSINQSIITTALRFTNILAI